jgi:hypothetical protein
MKKKCKIQNMPGCWTLSVDDQKINFQGWDAAEYFKKHYTELGYEVEFISE